MSGYNLILGRVEQWFGNETNVCLVSCPDGWSSGLGTRLVSGYNLILGRVEQWFGNETNVCLVSCPDGWSSGLGTRLVTA